MSVTKPFEGIRVIDLTTYIAAPVCGRMMAELGADVIKVEPLEGDIFRWFGPSVHVPANDDENPIYDVCNGSKKCVAMNLRDPKAVEAFHKLLATADVFLTNNREASLKKMGLDYDTLKEMYPRLIYAQITGYGEVGPDKDLPGFDTVAHFARAGFTGGFSESSGYLMTAPGGWGDASSGTALYGGVATALFSRERTGKGDKVTASLLGTGIWFGCIQNVATQECYGEVYPKTREMTDPLICTYKCKDGEWVMMSLLNFKAQFVPFCEALGITEMDGWTREDTLAKRPEAQAYIGAGFAKLTSAEAIEILNKISIVQTKCNTFCDNSKDEHAYINDFMRRVTVGDGKEIGMPMPPVKYRNINEVDYRRGPLLGEHTTEVLKSVGYSDEDIAAMLETKAVAQK